MKVKITFELDKPLTGIEKQVIETYLIDEYLADKIKIIQDIEEG